MRRQSLLTAAGFAGLAIVAVCGAPPDAAADDALAQAEVRELIEQLGDPEFRVREEASQRLVGLKGDIGPLLADAADHPDPEVRFRVRRILQNIAYNTRAMRLDAFLTDVGGNHGHTLPGWERFRDIMGEDSKKTRELLVSMLRADWDLLERAEERPEDAGRELAERCEFLQQAMRVARYQLTVGDIASILFVATNAEVDVPQQVGSIIYSFCYQTSFRNAMNNGAQQPLLRALLGTWIVKEDSAWSAYQRLMMAMRYSMKEGLQPARRMIQAGGATPQHYRQYAILALGKLGDKSDLPLLEKPLKDKTVCARHVRRSGKSRVTYETHISDVALAVSMHLHGEDPKKHGFSNISSNSMYLFSSNTLGFKDDSERKKVYEKWEKFLAEKRGESTEEG